MLLTTNDKISALRDIMLHHNVSATILPTADPHLSTVIADHYKERQWLSGFTGSLGTVIVTHDQSGLWVDSRYHLQGQLEIEGSEIALHKLPNQFGNEHLEWLAANLRPGDVVAVNGDYFSKSQIDQLKSFLDRYHLQLNTKLDLIGPLWADRPLKPQGHIYMHGAAFVGNSIGEKLQLIKNEMKSNDADYYLVSMLDEIAWLLNLRGSDIAHSPVFISYVLIGKGENVLYIDDAKLDDAIKNYLQDALFKIKPYDDIIPDLNQLSAENKVMVEYSTVNTRVYQAINGQPSPIDSPIRIAKGIKTDTELEHWRATMIHDGVALAQAYYWLEQTLQHRTVSEYELGEKIAHYRSTQPHYKGESFEPIVGYQSNGAIVHYHATKEQCKQIHPTGMLLVDCGGQYLGGTTDITRTFIFGSATAEQKRHYTLVLKAHIALSQAIFPEGTSGAVLEVIARQYLWQEGYNFLHGTGHGVGYHLNVHEGPHGFASPTTDRGRTPLSAGMTITNEPGLYFENQYGIRIENLMVVKKSKYSGYLDFETITLYPYDINLVDETVLTAKEKAWFNQYQRRVHETLSPHLKVELRDWFHFKCKMFG